MDRGADKSAGLHLGCNSFNDRPGGLFGDGKKKKKRGGYRMIKTPRLREIWIVGDARRDARGTGGPISRKQRTRGGGAAAREPVKWRGSSPRAGRLL